MIFDAAFRRMIASGKKRRHTVPRESERPPYQLGQVVPAQTLKMVPASSGRHSLGVQRANRRERQVTTFERLHICATMPSFLHEITDDDARAEGYPDLQALLDGWWERRHEGPGLPGDPWYPVEIPVWVVCFELEPVPPAQHLADTRRGKGDYTTGEGIGGGIVVETDLLDPQWRERAAQRFSEAQDAKRRSKKAAEQLRSSVARATSAGIDCKAEIAIIEQGVEQIRRKLAEAA